MFKQDGLFVIMEGLYLMRKTVMILVKQVDAYDANLLLVHRHGLYDTI